MPRFLTINSVIRKYTIEKSRDDHDMFGAFEPDESHLHTPEQVQALASAVRSGFPDACITWALSWCALTENNGPYPAIRKTVAELQRSSGDDIAFCAGGFFPNRYGTRDQVQRDINEAAEMIERFTGGYRPRSVIAGFLSSDNIRRTRQEMGARTVQGNIWSQYSVDSQDGDGSIAYPYYPSTEHFCKPAQAADDFIDCLNMDGWSVDLIAARSSGEYWKEGVRYCSRLGVGPLETLHTVGDEAGLAQMKATTDANFCAENVARNPFGWTTVNYEVAHVGLGHLAAFGEWAAWIKRTWPDTQCPTLAEFGAAVRNRYPDNDGLSYMLAQKGTGIGASFADQTVRWLMNRDMRLGILEQEGRRFVFDYADYRLRCSEPQGVGERNWSLLGEINQKQQRPQDKPVPLAQFLESHPDVLGRLRERYADQNRRCELERWLG